MRKPPPVYTAEHVFHPERDSDYVHFEDGASHPFQPMDTGVSKVNAWWLADSALMSYWPAGPAEAIFDRAGLQSDFLKEGSTDCYVVWRDDAVIVAFRGTEPDEWGDVLADAGIVLVPWEHGKVHDGFKKALDAIWPKLAGALADLAPGRTVWFCGHSLGAALATLAADRYASTAGVCTFGCPRVGDTTFAKAFDAKLGDRSARYVNHHDIVTHVPLPISYKHVGRRRVISAKGSISPDPPTIEHFFADLFGQPFQLLEIINAVRRGQIKSPPSALLEHMPKAYAIHIWNDYDKAPGT